MASPKLWKKDIVLKAIDRRGGMTYRQIQDLAILMAGLDPDERDATGRRAYRGYWSTTLSELLETHCAKGADGRYRVLRQDHRPDPVALRTHPTVHAAYERERRRIVSGGALPPGPFDSVDLDMSISWTSSSKDISFEFHDGKGNDRRRLWIRLPWPIPPHVPADDDDETEN